MSAAPPLMGATDMSNPPAKARPSKPARRSRCRRHAPISPASSVIPKPTRSIKTPSKISPANNGRKASVRQDKAAVSLGKANNHRVKDRASLPVAANIPSIAAPARGAEGNLKARAPSLLDPASRVICNPTRNMACPARGT